MCDDRQSAPRRSAPWPRAAHGSRPAAFSMSGVDLPAVRDIPEAPDETARSLDDAGDGNVRCALPRDAAVRPSKTTRPGAGEIGHEGAIDHRKVDLSRPYVRLRWRVRWRHRGAVSGLARDLQAERRFAIDAEQEPPRHARRGLHECTRSRRPRRVGVSPSGRGSGREEARCRARTA